MTAVERARRSLHGWKPGRRMRALHNSHAEDYGGCPQLYDFRHNLGMRSLGYVPALVVGRAMHAATATIRAGMMQPSSAFAAAALEIDGASKPRPGDQQQADNDTIKVASMIRGYLNRWHRELGPISTTANEVKLQAPLINPATGKESRTFFLEGTLDGFVQRSDGLWLYEQKTTSDTLADTLGYLKAGLQVPLYSELLSFNYGQPAGAILDVVKKPKLPKRKAETRAELADRWVREYADDPDTYFSRVELPYSEQRRTWALGELWRVAESIRASDKHGYRATRSWKVCKTPTGWCRFRSLCWYGDATGFAQKEEAA